MTRWLQTTVAAPLLVAAWGLAGGWHAAAQGPAATEDDLTRVPGATWTTVKPEAIGYSSPRSRACGWLKTCPGANRRIAADARRALSHWAAEVG